MSKKSGSKVSLYNRCLNGIERVGNGLPHPVVLFAMFALAIVAISAVCAALGVSATGELVVNGQLQETTISVVSLLTKEGLTYIFTSAVSNFTSYAPLGMVLVAMLGVGVAEQSGLIDTLLKRVVKATPAKLLTPMIVFLGVMPLPVWPLPSQACPAASPPTCSSALWMPCWQASPRPPCPSSIPAIRCRSWATISSCLPPPS